MDKQIEEMVKDLIRSGVEIKNDADLYAQNLYGLGYRKIPENAVVLTKEEKNHLFIEAWRKGYKFGGEETANGFL